MTPEQHERFNQLRDRFSTEMEEREAIQDMEDSQLRQDEETYLEMREQEDWRRGQVMTKNVFFSSFEINLNIYISLCYHYSCNYR